jgi:hypothetical protein
LSAGIRGRSSRWGSCSIRAWTICPKRPRRKGQFVQSGPGGDTPGSFRGDAKAESAARDGSECQRYCVSGQREKVARRRRDKLSRLNSSTTSSLEPSRSGPFGKAGRARSGQIVPSSFGDGRPELLPGGDKGNSAGQVFPTPELPFLPLLFSGSGTVRRGTSEYPDIQRGRD